MKMTKRIRENDSLLSSPDMVSEVEPVINDNAVSLPPELQYDPKQDPELSKTAMAESFWAGYNSSPRVREAGPSIVTYIKDYIKEHGNTNLQELAASLPEDVTTCRFYKNHLPELQQKINKVLASDGDLLKDSSAPQQKTFSPDSLTNDLAKELVGSGADAVETVVSAQDSANDKFDTIYSVARTILTGRGIKHHGFIYGAPGVGKCVSYDEKIPVKVDDATAKAFEDFLKSQDQDYFDIKNQNAKVGDIYEFAIAQGGKQENNESLFVNIPFELQIKDENGEWISSTKVYRKEDAIYEVEFSTKDGKWKRGRYAADHILPMDISHKLFTFVKELQPGDELPSGFTVVSVKKIKDKDYVYSVQADSETHLYQDVDGLIHHNTFSVKQAMKYEFPKGALARKGYTIEFNSGDIGRSASAIVAFFYRNREKKVIILDDCDAFLLSTDQAIQNLLKAMLDLDNTEQNPKYITVSPTIRNLASKLIAADSSKMNEGVEISVDEQRLREGQLTISVNGKIAYDEAATDEDKAIFKIKETKKTSKKHLDDASYFGLGLIEESLYADEDLDDGSLEDLNELNELENEEEEGIPPKWRFTSRLIMISNLKKTQLNDAVLSRTLNYGLFLTRDEFMTRLAQILPNLLTDVETEASPHMVDYAKKVAYAYLLAAVDIANNSGSVAGKQVVISGPLQFRIIAELAGKWMQRVDDYMIKNNISDESDGTLNRINNDIKMNFFLYDVIPSLRN